MPHPKCPHVTCEYLALHGKRDLKDNDVNGFEMGRPSWMTQVGPVYNRRLLETGRRVSLRAGETGRS